LILLDDRRRDDGEKSNPSEKEDVWDVRKPAGGGETKRKVSEDLLRELNVEKRNRQEGTKEMGQNDTGGGRGEETRKGGTSKGAKPDPGQAEKGKGMHP